MNPRSESLHVTSHDDRGCCFVLPKAKTSSASSVATTHFGFLMIGLLLLAGCSHEVATTPMEQAMVEFDKDHWDATIAACSEAIAQNPNNTAAYLLRGRAQHLAGRFDQAVADLTTAIRLNPQDSEAYYQRANAYRALGQTERKDEDNMTARKLDPSYSYQLKTDSTPVLDPALLTPEPQINTVKKNTEQESDDAFDPTTPSATDTQPKRSVVEDMFGMPPDLLGRDRVAPTQPNTPEKSTRRWPAPSDAETGAASNRGLAEPDRGVGNTNVSKQPSGLNATGHHTIDPAA